MKQKKHSNLTATASPTATASRGDPEPRERVILRESPRPQEPLAPEPGAAREQTLRAVLAAEDQRNLQLARLLHDSVGQHVAALLLGLRALETECGGSNHARLTLQSLHAIAQSIGHELHKIALEMRPTSLEDHGLARSLTTFLEEWSIATKIGVAFDPAALGDERLPAPLELTIFRIVRDALECVSVPGATHVSVILRREPALVSVIVENLGAGPVAESGRNAPAPPPLANLEARVALLGGRLAVERSTQGGTTVFARLPLPGASHA